VLGWSRNHGENHTGEGILEFSSHIGEVVQGMMHWCVCLMDPVGMFIGCHVSQLHWHAEGINQRGWDAISSLWCIAGWCGVMCGSFGAVSGLGSTW